MMTSWIGIIPHFAVPREAIGRPVVSPHKDQRHWALMFFVCASDKKAVEQTVNLPVIWDDKIFMWQK